MTRHRTLTSLALLASSLAIGISASPSPVSAAAVALPTPQYRLSVNAPSTATTPMKYSGRGSWTDVELLNGQLAVPLFKVGSDQKVPFQTSVIVSDLANATKVRAALDNVISSEGNGCFGNGANEQAALTAYVWDGTAWGASTGNLAVHESAGWSFIDKVSLTGNTATITTNQNHGLTTGDKVRIQDVDNAVFNGSDLTVTVTGLKTFTFAKTSTDVTEVSAGGSFIKMGNECWHLTLNRPVGGWTNVMFVVDLFCRTNASTPTNGTKPSCNSVSGLVPGGTNLMIEVEGSGDGEFNTGFASSAININSQTKAAGDVVTLVTADGTDAGVDPDPHGLSTGDVITGIAGCSGRGFAITKINDTSFSVVAACAPVGPVGANINRVSRGDEAYEVVFGTESVSQFVLGESPPNDFANSLTTENSLFVKRLTATISNISLTSNVATVVTATAHGFITNDVVEIDISGPNGEVFNGPRTITKVNDTTFTFPSTSENISSRSAVGTAVYRNWTGLHAVPLCATTTPANTPPCLESAPTSTSTGYSNGWSVMLLDDPTQGRFTIRPWRNAHPYYVTSGVSVSFSLRLPEGDFRNWANYAFDDGLSSAFSNAQINSFSYTAEEDYHLVEVEVTAREMSRVTRFDVTADGIGTEFFTDYCTGRIFVSEDGIVYIDANENFEYDSGEEDVLDCQNETDGFTIDRVSLWGDTAGSNDRAWIRAPGHTFTVGQTVTVCCAYGAFDGKQTVVAVGNPYGASEESGGANDWFAFSTASNDFRDKSFPRADGSSNPGWEVVTARAVNRNHIRVTATAVTLDLSLSQVGPACPASICGFNIPSNQHLAGGFISTNAQAFAFGQGMDSETPSFDFGVAGPSFNSAGVARTTDGFFRACIPARFLASKFGGIAAATAATQINGTSASSAANRNGALVAAAATCGEPGGVLASLNQFGFSAPYFAIRPRVASLGSTPATTATTTTAPPASTTTTSPSTTTNTIPPGRVPGPGRAVTIPNAPSPRVADAVGMKVSSNSVTLALNPTAASVRRGQTYEVTLVGPDGKRRTIRITPRSDSRNVTAAFQGLPPGEYQVIVRVRNRNGTASGRWSSPLVRVGR